MSDLLKEAIAGLNINVPIYRTEEQNGILILFLYGGRVVHWPPADTGTTAAGTHTEPDPNTTSPTLAPTGGNPDPDPVTMPPTLATPDGNPGPDTVTMSDVSKSAKETSSNVCVADFTAMPYVGDATAKALHSAGFRTFQDLIDADDTQLLDVPKVNTYTLSKIRSYLYIHFS